MPHRKGEKLSLKVPWWRVLRPRRCILMYAIVKTGGKQYKVAEGDVLFVEKLDAQAGDVVTLYWWSGNL